MDTDTTTFVNSKEDLIRRLRKIEGQVKGLQRMIDNDEVCVDVLTQISAVRAAIHKVGTIVFENHSKRCLRDAVENNNKENAIEDLIGVLTKFVK